VTKQTNRRRDTNPARTSSHSPHAPQTFQLVELRWILKALAAVVALAVVCGYVTLCVVFSRNQWQLVLHPSRQVTKTPASLGLKFAENPIDHDPNAFDAPRMYGWNVPAVSPNQPTVLLLHSGDGSMSDALPIVRTLHDANLNVFVFDYRGYGRSADTHPTEATMEADSDSALAYLAAVQGIRPGNIIIFGSGVGGSLATRLCAEHPELPALILDHPEGDLKPQIVRHADALLPARILFNQDFPLAAPLRTLSTPKLLLTTEENSGQQKLHDTADPKMIVTYGVMANPDEHNDIRRFLDTYVPHPPQSLTPNP
jgi:pimeloyl-ACP methyl ester carboxylesterase